MKPKANSKKRAPRSRGQLSNFPVPGVEVPELTKAVRSIIPKCGTINQLATGETPFQFDRLPLSQRSKQGLLKSKYKTMTEIQRAVIPHALCGRDILAAAKTGSGKTLAFVLAIVERLYRLHWSPSDGLGALIIAPTRELTIQIFEVLRSVGCFHGFSAGVVIGGTDFKFEAERIAQMNILVATPGRILQHMDQTPGFTCDNLKLLVLDEADRLLDMGFKESLNAIILNLSKSRQTMLFSATQTKSIKDLARLSLSSPEYIGIHDKAESATPAKLEQHYMTIDLPTKLNVLFSFIRSHPSNKSIVFFATCKQVKFIYEAIRQLRCGTMLFCLHGKMSPTKRVDVYNKYKKAEKGCLFCTDVAARGLDFPDLEWVVQYDCPEDVDSYLHRAGRTARYKNAGNSLLFLLPSEGEMVKKIETRNVPLQETQPNIKKMKSITGDLVSLLISDPSLKLLAQKACVAYLRSIHLMHDKSIFNVTLLPFKDYSASLGLPSMPQVKFSSGGQTIIQGGQFDDNQGSADEGSESDSDFSDESDSDDDKVEKKPKKKTKMERLFSRKNQLQFSSDAQQFGEVAESDDTAGVLSFKRTLGQTDAEKMEAVRKTLPVKKTSMSKIKQKKAKKPTGQQMHFTDDGKSATAFEKLASTSAPKKNFKEEVRSKLPEIGRATSELQSHSFISYAVFCLKKKN
eukprot:TRINITY_DN5388_c0_g1_i2.p1 TRINITY_DN5388_c0_g1~~TRINITY_DN5388_c0_g1_i2.p1  ORF type:complete len:686 (-),score=151.28 TRINITY_DN5388_c0_g1_i2:43-2100(-)